MAENDITLTRHHRPHHSHSQSKVAEAFEHAYLVLESAEFLEHGAQAVSSVICTEEALDVLRHLQ